MGVKPIVLGSDRLVNRSREVSAVEVVAVSLVVLSVLIVTALPYAFAYRSAPPDKQFMGILLNVPDTAQYLSWARESAGAFFVENKLTPEPGDAAYFNLFWLVVGRLSFLAHVSLVDAMQVVRWVAGAVYLAATYWFISLVVRTRIHRLICFLVVSLGGGIGWVLVLLKQITGQLIFPLDLYVTEPNTFLTVLAFPLQAMAGGLLILTLGLAALALEQQSIRLAAVAGLTALLLGLQHGYDLLVVYAVVGSAAAVWAWRTRRWFRASILLAIIGGPSVPAAAYLLYLTRASAIWRGVLAQYGNAGVFTPNPFHLLILMGLPAIALVVLPKKHDSVESLRDRELLLRCWLVVGFFLLYVPTNFQIKMLGGWQIPVAILAAREVLTRFAPAMGELFPAASRRQLLLGIVLVAAVLPVNAYLYAWRFVDLGRHDYPYYLHRDDVAALSWLGANAKPSDVVLSSLTIGQYVPYVTGTHAFLAHWAETLDYYAKQRMVAQFFDSTTSESRRTAILSQYDVRYVFYGSEERVLGSYNPGDSPDFVRVFKASSVSVFQVREPSTTVRQMKKN